MPEQEENLTAGAGVADLRWLIVGAVAGLLAAGYGILRQNESGSALPTNAVARVNEQIIDRALYDRAYSGLVAYGAGDEEKGLLLQRLVDDELLVQRALELGMAQSDAEVRNAIVDSLIASVTAEADAANPTDEELERYLDDNEDRFSYVASVAVEAWRTDDESTAQSFIASLRIDGEAMTSELIAAIPDLPPGLVPIEILRDYLGPGIAAATADMPIGSSAVFARRGRWLVVRVLEKKTAAVNDLDSIRNRVLLDFRRLQADQLLRDYIGELRSRADVDVAQP